MDELFFLGGITGRLEGFFGVELVGMDFFGGLMGCSEGFFGLRPGIDGLLRGLAGILVTVAMTSTGSDGMMGSVDEVSPWRAGVSGDTATSLFGVITVSELGDPFGSTEIGSGTVCALGWTGASFTEPHPTSIPLVYIPIGSIIKLFMNRIV